MIYKTLKKVSDYCQLLDKSKYPATQTINGVTFTNNGDGSFTVSGTAPNTVSYVAYNFQVFDSSFTNKYFIPGHKIIIDGGAIKGVVSSGANIQWILAWSDSYIAADSSNKYPYTIGEYQKNNYNHIELRVYNGETVNFTFKPQLFDLTEMYGAGNEPTTVEQFRQDFPEEMYDYKPYCFVKSYKTLLKASNVCQLLDKSQYPGVITNAGVTTTSNGDGSITINGTATGSGYINCTHAYPKENNGHVFYICANNTTMSKSTWSYGLLNQYGHIKDYGNGVIGKTDASIGRSTGITFNKGIVFDNVIIKPQIIDLTEMYGAGNEPTTVEEFREKFPNELYDYKPYSIITSYKKSFKVTNSILL